jgi:2-polyprenyl-6-methoxyphenol hydroxylase-like FAD-dependent oxidoreductase
VTTTQGELPADLVVDATGRRSRAPEWCQRAGVAPPTIRTVGTGQVYFTRWFRGPRAFTSTDPMLRVDLSFATLFMYPADSGWFSATFFAPAHDAPLRRRLMDPDGFVAAIRAVPSAATWMERAHPVGSVQFMGKLANQLRRPARSGQSPAGLVPVADAAVCTNPAWGRGAALALAHAAALVRALAESDEPAALTRAMACWSAQHLEPWFHDTLLLDTETNAIWAGRQPARCAARPFCHRDAVRLARTDPRLFLAYLRYRNLLDPPAAFWSDSDLVARVRTAVSAGAVDPEPPLPSRAELLVDETAPVSPWPRPGRSDWSAGAGVGGKWRKV